MSWLGGESHGNKGGLLHDGLHKALVGSLDHVRWVLQAEQHLSCAVSARRNASVVFAVLTVTVARIHAIAVLAVVNEYDAVGCDQGGRPRFHEGTVEFAAPRTKEDKRAEAFESGRWLVRASPVLGPLVTQYRGPADEVVRNRHINRVLAPKP